MENWKEIKEKFRLVNNELWYLHKSGKKYCKVKSNCKVKKYNQCDLNGKSYMVHRVVYYLYYKPDPKLMELMVIDHINRNTHDNRPENLRMVTHSDNSKNRVVSVSCGEIDLIGVFTCGKKYRSRVQIEKKINLGAWNTPELAALARDKYIINNNIQNKRLNFYLYPQRQI